SSHKSARCRPRKRRWSGRAVWKSTRFYAILDPREKMMKSGSAGHLASALQQKEGELLAQWLKQQLSDTTLRADLLKESELKEQSRQFLTLLQKGAQSGKFDDIGGAEWTEVRDFLGDLSRTRAQQGFSPSETATFIFSLKQPLF